MGATPPPPRLDSLVEALNAASGCFVVIGGFAVIAIRQAIDELHRYLAATPSWKPPRRR
jgi:hypothetical protein